MTCIHPRSVFTSSIYGYPKNFASQETHDKPINGQINSAAAVHNVSQQKSEKPEASLKKDRFQCKPSEDSIITRIFLFLQNRPCQEKG